MPLADVAVRLADVPLSGVVPPDLAAVVTDELEPSAGNGDDAHLFGAAVRADAQDGPLFFRQHLVLYFGTDCLQKESAEKGKT